MMHFCIGIMACWGTMMIATAQSQAPTTSKTDIGSILKSMDPAKLALLPPDARAVMVKMPESANSVTPADRDAIKACIANTSVDAFGVQACLAQEDQLSLVLDRKSPGNANMVKFVNMAKANGATVSKP